MPNALLKFKSLRPEQWGAFSSYAATVAVSLSKDRDSFLATGTALLGETMFLLTVGDAKAALHNLKRGDLPALMRRHDPPGFERKPGDERILGETAFGYSAAYAVFMLSQFALAASKTTGGNHPLQWVVEGLAASWLVALSRYPAEEWAHKLKKAHPERGERWQRYADNVRPFVGGSSFAMRFPMGYLAARGHHWVMLGATLGWGVGELLMGNAFQKAQECAAHVRHKVEDFVHEEGGRPSSSSRRLLKEALGAAFRVQPESAPLPETAMAVLHER